MVAAANGLQRKREVQECTEGFLVDVEQEMSGKDRTV